MSSRRVRDRKPTAGEFAPGTGDSGVSRRKTAGHTGRLALGAVLAVLLIACGANTPKDLAADFPITVYTGAEALGGTDLNFSDLRGQPIILNFWAGLCPPCRAEMPDLQQFYDEYQERTLLIGVDVGQFTGLGNQTDARALLDALEITYPTGFTSKGTVLQDYGVISMPTTLFITSKGQVFHKWAGVLNIENLTKTTNEMLGQEPG